MAQIVGGPAVRTCYSTANKIFRAHCNSLQSATRTYSRNDTRFSGHLVHDQAAYRLHQPPQLTVRCNQPAAAVAAQWRRRAPRRHSPTRTSQIENLRWTALAYRPARRTGPHRLCHRRHRVIAPTTRTPAAARRRRLLRRLHRCTPRHLLPPPHRRRSHRLRRCSPCHADLQKLILKNPPPKQPSRSLHPKEAR